MSVLDDNKVIISKICKSIYKSSLKYVRGPGWASNDFDCSLLGSTSRESVQIRMSKLECVKVIEYRGKISIGLDIEKCEVLFFKASGREPGFPDPVLHKIDNNPFHSIDPNFLPVYQLDFNEGTVREYDYLGYSGTYKLLKTTRSLYDIVEYASRDIDVRNLTSAVWFKYKGAY
jgi:hypothetical protein